MSARIAYYDNAKFLLIVLVVIGHILEVYLRTDAARSLYIFLYAFHMPLFVFISGHFANANPLDDNRYKNINKILLLYLLFQILYSLFRIVILDVDLKWNAVFFRPYHLMWFLLSLYFWKIALPAFSRLKWPFLWAIFFALFFGYATAGVTLSISRTFVFFPFFLAGWYVRDGAIDTLNKRSVKILSAIILCTGIIMAFRFQQHILLQWLFNKLSYDAGNYSMIHRSVYILVAFLLGGSFLSLVPRTKTAFTILGEHTLYVYLLHKFFILIYVKNNFHTMLPAWIFFFLGIVYCVVFSMPQLYAVLEYMMKYWHRCSGKKDKLVVHGTKNEEYLLH